jgi:pseudoazurin
MTSMMRSIAPAALGLALATAALAGGIAPASAAEHEVKMLNKGEAGMMVFEPAYLEIAPGDTVTFVVADKGHNAETIKGMLPEGAEPFAGKINQEISVTFETEGLYGYMCKPHYAMGMVGLIAVGDPTANLATAKEVKQPGRAKQVMAGLLDQVGN